MCSVEELIYNDQIYFNCKDLKRVPQESFGSGILQFWCGLPILFINTSINKYKRLWGVSIRINCQTAELGNAWEMVRLRKTAGVYRSSKLSLCWNAVHLTTCQRWRAVCWSHRPSSKGSKANARTAFSVAQDVERSLGSPRMLHGHLHQLHASSISCMLNRRVFHKMLPHWQGKFTTVQVDIEQPYVHCTKKKDPSTGIPCIFEKFKNRPDFALLIRADRFAN